MTTIKYLLLACLLSLPSLAAADWPQEGKTPESLMPAGWEILRSAEGDLNGDGLPDVALVIRGTDPAMVREADRMVGEMSIDPKTGAARSFLNENPRVLMVLLGQPSGGYRVVANNSVIVPAARFPNGEVLDNLAIADRQLQLGMIFMDRTHGQRYATLAYRFVVIDGGVLLSDVSKRVFLRQSDEEEQRDYNLKKGEVTVEKTTFVDQKPHSRETRKVEGLVPVPLAHIAPGWAIESDFQL